MVQDSRIESYSIVPNPGGDAVLLVTTGDAWGLPSHPHATAVEVNPRIKREFGLDVTVATTFGEIFHDGGHEYLLAHENHGSAGELPRGARWVWQEELDSLDLAVPGERKILEEWFALGAGQDTAVLSPAAWARRGWFAEAASWMTEAAARHDLAVTGPVQQFGVSPYSVTMRVPTSEGYLYFKAAPPEFGYEPSLVRAIAERFPEHSPEVLEIDRERSWMLTRGVEPFWQLEPTLEHVELYERMVRTYARMQQELIGQVGTLTAMGVPDRRPARLPVLLEELLQDTATLCFEGDYALSAEEHSQLLAYVPRFAEQCAKLAEFALPNTLQNVDFWRDNIAVTNDGFVFLDWAESVVASPAHSMNMVLRDFVIHDVRDKDILHHRMLDAYMGEWTAYESMERLHDAYRLSRPGSVLCRALSWRDSIASLGDPRRHAYLRPSVPGNVRRLLEFTDIA